ncbi:MAG: hypothetical protein V1773_00520 [bacterium]
MRAEIFIELMLASDEVFEKLILSPDYAGVRRLTTEQIEYRYPEESIFFFTEKTDKKITCFDNVNVVDDINIIGIQNNNLNSLFCINSSFPNITYKNVKLLDVENKTDSIFCFYNCNINDINIYGSTIGNFSFWENNIGNINIKDSTVGNFSFGNDIKKGNFNRNISKEIKNIDINNSKTGEFRVANGIKIGFFYVQNMSKVENILISNSETEEIILSNSETKDIKIFESKTGAYKILNSKTGSFSIEKNVSKGNFEINNSKTGDFNISEDSIIGDFSINEKSVTENFSIMNSRIGKFTVTKSIIENINISESDLENFIITDSQTGSFSVEKNKSKADFTINNSTIIDFRAFNESLLGNYCAQNNSIMRNFYIENSSMAAINLNNCEAGNFTIENGYLEDFKIITSTIKNISINKNSIIVSDVSLTKSELVKFIAERLYFSLFVFDTKMQLLRVDYCDMPEFNINASKVMEVFINGGNINLIKFSNFTLIKEAFISISGSKLYVINFKEFTVLGNLYFRKVLKANDCFVWTDNQYNTHNKKCYEEDYEKKCELLKKDFINATIRISQSSLGNTEFTDCSLDDFTLQYDNSIISECFIMGGNVSINDVEILDSNCKVMGNCSAKFKQQALIYNQFRKIFESEKDIYLSTKFQSKAADCQKKYLNYKRQEKRDRELKINKNENEYNVYQLIKLIIVSFLRGIQYSYSNNLSKILILIKRSKIYKLLKTYFNEESQDIYALSLNKLLNNHGENWLKALFWIFFPSIMFYVLYLWSLERCFNNNEFDINLVGYYFEFLNPIHKNNYIDDSVKAGGLTVFIDFFAKLVVGFCIYKFLTAFKKHGRK